MSATLINPVAVKAFGNQSLLILQEVETPTAVSLADEIGATDTVNATLIAYRDPGFNPTGEAAKGTAPARLGETVDREEFQATTRSIPDISYLHDPQAADSAEANKVRAGMPEGSIVYILERLGFSGTKTAYATTQKYLLHHVRCGPQIWGKTSQDANGEFCINQSLTYVTTEPIHGVIAV